MGLKQRAVASGIHFLFSLAIFSAFLLTIIFLWFPEPYFTSSGGLQGISLVAAVDLVLGPLLTFIVFNKAKRRNLMIMDLSFIISIQMIALIWGIHTVYTQRPVAIVFWENSFFTVPDKALSRFYEGTPELQDLRNNPRQLIYAVKPPVEDTDARQAMQRRVEKQIPPHHQIEIYRPFSEHFDRATQFNLDIQEIESLNAEMKAQLDDVLHISGGTRDQYIYLPLKSRYRNIVLIFDREGQLIGQLQAPYL
jgi:hypothetical protein